ncbi:MAG TPA: amidohydrolase [Ktedonobacteraceae bacterium]|jgi:predicted amidohydrolase YtcJ|nr:amidohydrolase [Ktedonobacteraceae bacterium]
MTTILYLNGTIYTMDAAQPRAQAIAIDSASGRILAVGDNDEIRRMAVRDSEMIDLRGKTMLPGFIDAHIHLVEAAYRRHYIDASGTRSEAEVARLVQQRAEQTPPGQWIQGGRWDKNLWPGQQFPGRASLDAVAPAHPVALWSKDGHLLWVNSLALQRAAITAATPDPANGAILRDSNGEPTGVLEEEEATSLVYRVIDKRDPLLTRHLTQNIIKDLQRSGITSIHDIEARESFTLFQQLRDEGQLGVRVEMFLPRHMLPELREIGLQAGFGDDLLRFAGIKIFADGTLGSQTAAMLEGFEGNPHNKGILTLPEAEMNEIVRAAAEMGISIAIHAIGDRAAHVALNSIEQAQQSLAGSPSESKKRRLRYRLEHVQLITSEDLARLKRLGVVASVQPFHAVADREIAERYWGRRHRHAYAYHTMQRMGIPLALGSDAPVETFDPVRILYAATMRNDITTPQRPPWLPDQALPVAQALWDYTVGAAYAAAQEDHKGSLTPGKLGDAVVLREDILNVPPQKMVENGVQATILGGRIVYGEL